MSRSVRVPEELYIKAAELAARDRLSVEEFVSILLANRVVSREYIESRARRFDRADFDHVLGQVPDLEPDELDRP